MSCELRRKPRRLNAWANEMGTSHEMPSAVGLTDCARAAALSGSVSSPGSVGAGVDCVAPSSSAASLLGEAGALVERGGRPLKVATRTLWAPYHSFVDTQLKRARFALRDLRAALAPALARQSDDAARLVHLDGVLLEAIHPKVEALMRRVPHALERAFAAHLAAAVAALPDPPTAEDVAPWFTAAGWIPPWFAQGEVLCRAVVDHERLRLASLVEACLSAGVGDGAPSS